MESLIPLEVRIAGQLDDRILDEIGEAMCKDLAWIIDAVHKCGHDECRKELTRGVFNCIINELNALQQVRRHTTNDAHAEEIADAALARASHKEKT